MSNYSSTGEVKALARWMLDGQANFNSTTTPTGTDVSGFLSRACNVLDMALAGMGLAVPVTNTTAKSACDDWVTAKVVAMCELTQRGAGSNEGENQRGAVFAGLAGSANKFAKENALSFKRLGCSVSHAKSEGLVFTGETAVEDRSDPGDDSLRQPAFRRELFDNTGEDDE